jgi:hypothetical protein
VLRAWNQIGSSQALGTLTAAALTTDITAANTLVSNLSKLEIRVGCKHNQRDAALASLWNKVKRARAIVKGNYGDGCYQYNLFGGTRLSDKKVPSRKTIP